MIQASMPNQSSVLIAVVHGSDVKEARQRAQVMALAIGFDETASAEVALAVSELGANLLRHTKGGTLTLTPLVDGRRVGMQVISQDHGPGIERRHFPFFIVAHRKNDDRHLTPFAQTPQHIHAIGIGKSEIEQDNIRPSGGRIRKTLRGGFGLDVFDYNAANHSGVGAAGDTIQDFSTAEGDKIDFADIDAGVLAFIGAAAFSGGGAHQVRVAAVVGGQLVQVDVNGDAAADMEILVQNSGLTVTLWVIYE